MVKLLKVIGLLLLFLVGLIVLVIANIAYVSSKVPVSLLGDGTVNVGLWDYGVVNAKGTWIIEGKGHAFPLNVSTIRCARSTQVCTIAEAVIFNGYLNSEIEIHAVTRWDSANLEYITDANCVTYVYAINRATASISGKRTLKAPAPAGCSDFILDGTLTLRFVNGVNVVLDLQAKEQPIFLMALASASWLALIVFWIISILRKPRLNHRDYSAE